MAVQTPLARLRLGAALGALVLAAGTIGFRLMGLGWVEALYTTMITITPSISHEYLDFNQGERIFTIALIVTGVGAMAYVFTHGMQALVEGQVREAMGRRKMDKQIANMQGHVVLCGWGRVGRAIGEDLTAGGCEYVVVDTDPGKLTGVQQPTLVGDATSTSVLQAAGVDRANALVTALRGDAENLLATLTARDIDPDVFIVARARADESVDKLTHAGADRVINPDSLGAARMSSFIVQPSVAEFVDMLMHDPNLDLQIREVLIPDDSRLVGLTLGDCENIEKSGVVVLALREVDGVYYTNPDPEIVVRPGQFIIGIGTDRQFVRLRGTIITGKETI